MRPNPVSWSKSAAGDLKQRTMITIQEDRELWAVFLFGLCALLIAFTQELADGRIELGDRQLKRLSDSSNFFSDSTFRTPP